MRPSHDSGALPHASEAHPRPAPRLDRLDDRCLLSATPQGLSPQQLATAYGLNNVIFNVSGYAVPGDGRGQTIAVIDVDHDPYIYADLAKYDATFNLATPALHDQELPGHNWFNVVDLAGNTTDDGWAEEEALDVETVHTMAPGASILVIEAASDSLPDLINAINFARYTTGVSVVSMSWGESEFPSEAAYDSYFTSVPSHVGTTFISAAGDSPGVEWPASSPHVIGVGGTTLTTTASGAYISETAWSSSGGGLSQYEPEPAYQYGVQSSGRRSVPDVAFDADPNTGLSIYATDPSTGRGTWSVFGGTSLGAPAWAGVMSIIDEGYLLAGVLPSLDGTRFTLPILYGHPSSMFHSVAPASTRHGATVTLTTTGLGTPNGVAFLESMINYSLFAYSGATGARAAQPAATATSSVAAPTSTARTIAPALTAATPAATAATPLGPGQGLGTPAATLANALPSGGPSLLAWMSAVVDAVTGPARPVASPADVAVSDAPAVLAADVPAPPTAVIPASPPAPVPSRPVSSGPTFRVLPVVTGVVAPPSLIAADPTAPAPLQNAPRLFDAALGAWDDEEFSWIG